MKWHLEKFRGLGVPGPRESSSPRASIKERAHVFVLTYLPPNWYFATPPPLDDVTFGKWAFEKMSGGLGKNSEPLPRSWDLEEFQAFLWASIGT